MFNLTGVFAHLMGSKQPALTPMQQYLAELAAGQVSSRTMRELQEWDQQERDAIRQSLDELVEELERELRVEDGPGTASR